ncbi:hypothetical protein F4808DRAFT_463192 [Astrocystis sublimbata]|nr:hypothetical protein F4808DRAFT_463192 [Astrocystis sublimbata]
MPLHQVLAKTVIGSMVKDAMKFTLSVATKTNFWQRSEKSAKDIRNALTKSVAQRKQPLPAGTIDLCAREGPHKSKSDRTNHLTVVHTAADGARGTMHVAAAKKNP